MFPHLIRRRFPLLASLFACGTFTVSAVTNYVATTGSDTDPGTFASPWRTIQKAASMLAPGDTALVRGGIYSERVTVNVSGSAAGGRGMGAAGKVVLLIDGAVGLENMGRLNFKDSIQIVDFYHAMEHAGQVLEALIGKGHPDYKKQQSRWARGLLKDKVRALIKAARRESAGGLRAAAVAEALGYFVRNESRMQYGTFRAAGYFIGSGVVVAGCKTVIGGRCKQSGMFWSKAGAENILALRCIHSSRRLDTFWEYRLNTQPRNSS